MHHAIRHSVSPFARPFLYPLYLVLIDLVLAHLVAVHSVLAHLVLALVHEVFLLFIAPTSGLPFSHANASASTCSNLDGS